MAKNDCVMALEVFGYVQVGKFCLYCGVTLTWILFSRLCICIRLRGSVSTRSTLMEQDARYRLQSHQLLLLESNGVKLWVRIQV